MFVINIVGFLPLCGGNKTMMTECVLMCLLRLPESESDLKHSLQVNDFSPE